MGNNYLECIIISIYSINYDGRSVLAWNVYLLSEIWFQQMCVHVVYGNILDKINYLYYRWSNKLILSSNIYPHRNTMAEKCKAYQK